MIIQSDVDESKTKHNKRIKILEEAYKLFLEYGIENVSMLEIADKSGMQRRSLYNYYDDKEQIAGDLMKCWYQAMEEVGPVKDTADSTLEQIRNILYQFCEKAISEPDMIIYSVQFDQYFRNHANGNQMIDYSAWALTFLDKDDLLSKGIKDGSIDVKYQERSEEFERIIQGVVLSFSQRVLYNEKVLQHEHGHTRAEIRGLVDFIVLSLKAN